MRAGARILIAAAVVAAAAVVVAMRPGGTVRDAVSAGSSSSQAQASPPTLPSASSAVQVAGLPRLVELGSDRCQACKAMAPVLDELRAEYPGKLQVDFIDVWVDRSAVATYRVDLIPTQVYYDGAGRELGRRQGFHSRKEIVETFREFGILL